MSYKKTLEAMSVEEVTEKLEDLCEQTVEKLSNTDQKLWKTFLKASVNGIQEHQKTLVKVASEKNGVPYKFGQSFETVVKNIIQAAEARGQAVPKLHAYLDYLSSVKEKTEAGIAEIDNLSPDASAGDVLKTALNGFRNAFKR